MCGKTFSKKTFLGSTPPTKIIISHILGESLLATICSLVFSLHVATQTNYAKHKSTPGIAIELIYEVLGQVPCCTESQNLPIFRVSYSPGADAGISDGWFLSQMTRARSAPFFGTTPL